MLKCRVNLNRTYLVDDLLRDIVLNIRCDIIVESLVQLHGLLGLGPQALMDAVINDTAYESGFDGEPARHNLSS